MTDAEWLFLYVGLIYLADCLCWVRRPSAAFVSHFLKSWRVIPGDHALGNNRGGVILLNPIPPLGRVYVADPPVVSLSPEGVAQRHPAATGDRDAVLFDALESCEIVATELYINRKRFASCATREEALAAQRLIAELKDAKPKKREETIRRTVRQSFDAAAVRERLVELRRHYRYLFLLCHLQLLHIFAVLPYMFLHLDVMRTVVTGGAVMYLLSLNIAVSFWLAHSTIFPDSRYERIMACLEFLIFPPAAVRAMDKLSKHALAWAHPVTLAHVLGDEKDLRSLASKVLREREFPIENPDDTDPIEQWFDHEVHEAFLAFLHGENIDRHDLLAAPDREDPAAVAYCPRCLAQFVVETSDCPDCPGVAATPFEKTDRELPDEHV